MTEDGGGNSWEEVEVTQPVSQGSSTQVDAFQPKSVYEIMVTPHRQQRPQSAENSKRSSSDDGTASGLGYERATNYARPGFYYSHRMAMAHNQLNADQHNNMQSNRRFAYLPFPMPWKPIAGPAEPPLDFGWISESCGGKAAIGVFGGGVMGLIMGVFLGAMSDMTPPVTVINGKEVPQAPLKEQMRTTLRATGEKSMYWCRQFAFITGVFSGSECLVEKCRGKHDIWNGVMSGCITGAAMQAKSGPQAAALGCGGFAAFSLVIEQFMGNY